MKRFSVMVLLAACVVLLAGPNAFGGYSITFPSTSVDANSNVNYSINGSWDVPMQQITVPIVVRSNDPGASWTGALPIDTIPSDPGVGVTWNWASSGWAVIIEEVRGGVPAGVCPTAGDWAYDGIAPDHLVITAQGAFVFEAAAPTGRDFITLNFDIGPCDGSFEFDTACFTGQLNTIFMVDGQFPPVDHGGQVVFTKGTVTISNGLGTCNAPVITVPGAQNVDEGENLNFTVSATDADGTTPSLSAMNVPKNATFTDNGNGTGTFNFNPDAVQGDGGIYTVKFIASDGTLGDMATVAIDVNDVLYVEDITTDAGIPENYELMQNYPNPFNARTTIEFAIKQDGWVKLDVYNILGQQVATPVNEFLTAGVKRTTWDGKDFNGKNVASGMYFYRLIAGDLAEVKKMVLLK